MTVSIIICTRNRAQSLAATLASVGQAIVPQDWDAELLVVDNGSSDATATVVRGAQLTNLRLRYLQEPTPGQCHARNAGLANTTGQVIIFTDDDVRFPSDWILRMCQPIVEDEADAVAGGVRLAPHLERSWLAGDIRGWLACTDVMLTSPVCEGMIGANMAFSRAVLQRVPRFDTELGPGALGFYDEALFSRQLIRAGYRLVPRPEVAVEHHFDPARLDNASLLDLARRLGRSCAYVSYHWEHDRLRLPRVRLAMRRVKAAWCSLLHQCRMLITRGSEPSPERLYSTFGVAVIQQYLLEQKRPRNYEKHGLLKRADSAATIQGDPDMGPSDHGAGRASMVRIPA